MKEMLKYMYGKRGNGKAGDVGMGGGRRGGRVVLQKIFGDIRDAGARLDKHVEVGVWWGREEK